MRLSVSPDAPMLAAHVWTCMQAAHALRYPKSVLVPPEILPPSLHAEQNLSEKQVEWNLVWLKATSSLGN
jgi:hypothetical protein